MNALYRGSLLHMLDRHTAEYIPDGSLLVQDGRIRTCGPFDLIGAGHEDVPCIDWRGSLIIPGLVDSHAHVAQLPAIGCDRPNLLQWLDEVIYPIEKQYTNPTYAYTIARNFFHAALRHGTTTIAVYAPPSPQATDACFQAAQQLSIRAIMGMTLMDCNAPVELTSSPRTLITDAEKLAASWHNAGNGRLQYCITPRFAGCCSIELLSLCGAMARHTGLPIQTHLAESAVEIATIHARFPDFPDNTSIYEHTGLINERTILAHCIYLTDNELKRIEQLGAAIIHCPSSNIYLRSGIMPLAQYSTQYKLRIGLGSDIGAGYNHSMISEARTAREVSKVLTLSHDTERVITNEEVFYLATLGGADALGMSHLIGNFAIGKFADFVRISIQPWRHIATAHDALEYILYGDMTIQATIIAGELVWQST